MVVLAGVLHWVSPAAGQNADLEALGLEAAVAALDSEDFAVRESATEALASDGGAGEAEIVRLLGRGGLSAEQRYRLEGVMRRRFMESPRGAIGISFEMDERNPTQIGKVHKGFPCGDAGLLRPKDVIVSVEGHALGSGRSTGRTALLLETCSRDPGEILRMRIRRSVDGVGEREIEVDVPLGSEATFVEQGVRRPEQPPVFADTIKSMAYEFRLRRLGVGREEVRRVRPAVEEGMWEGVSERVSGRAARWNRLLAGAWDHGAEAAGNFPNQAIAQRDAQMIRALERVRLDGDRRHLPNALNVEIQLAEGGRVQIRRAELPEELKRNPGVALRRLQAEAARRRAARRSLALDKAGDSEVEEALPDFLSEANRIATRIGALEAEIAAQTRVLRETTGSDPNIVRLGEERLAELRAALAVERERLERTIELAGLGLGIDGEVEASVGNDGNER